MASKKKEGRASVKKFILTSVLICHATLAWGQGRFTVIPVEGATASAHQWMSWAYVVDRKDSKMWHCFAQVFDKGRRNGECLKMPSRVLSINANTEIKLSGRNTAEHEDRKFLWFVDSNTGIVHFCGFGMGRVEESCFQYPPLP